MHQNSLIHLLEETEHKKNKDLKEISYFWSGVRHIAV